MTAARPRSNALPRLPGGSRPRSIGGLRKAPGGLHRQVLDPSEQLERARELRERIAAWAAALARTEEEVARIHDELAARRPGGAYRRIADAARKDDMHRLHRSG